VNNTFIFYFLIWIDNSILYEKIMG